MSERICLIVDDEPSIRAYLKAILETEHFQVLEAENAPQGFKLVEKLNGGLDLIVTDVKMPGDMDGLDLAYAVRNAFSAIPVILMSGYPSPENSNNRLEDFAFILKPFKSEVIREAVRKLQPPTREKIATL